KGPSQLRDVDVHQLSRRSRLPPRPEHIDEGLRGDNFVRVDEQKRQQCARLEPANRDLTAVCGDLERPQDPELHVSASSDLNRRYTAANEPPSLPKAQPRDACNF